MMTATRSCDHAFRGPLRGLMQSRSPKVSSAGHWSLGSCRGWQKWRNCWRKKSVCDLCRIWKSRKGFSWFARSIPRSHCSRCRVKCLGNPSREYGRLRRAACSGSGQNAVAGKLSRIRCERCPIWLSRDPRVGGCKPDEREGRRGCSRVKYPRHTRVFGAQGLSFFRRGRSWLDWSAR